MVLSRDIFNSLKDIAVEYNLDLLVLFGSQALGNAKKDSDYDIAYLFLSELGVSFKENLYNTISEILDFQKVDLVDLSLPISPKLSHEVFSKGILLYEKKKGTFVLMKEKSYFDLIDAQELLYKTRDKFLAKT